MTTPTPTDRVLALLIPWMSERGFTYRKKGHMFARPFALGHHEYSLEFDGRGGFVSTGAFIGLQFTALAQAQKAAGLHESQVFMGLRQAGAARSSYDLYLDEYMNMTPRQRKGITSEQTHPQDRIEAGVVFLQDSFERFAQPLFDRVRTERELADYFLAAITGNADGAAPHPGALMPSAVLLARRLGDDPAPILAAGAQWLTQVMTRDRVDLALAAPMPEA